MRAFNDKNIKAFLTTYPPRLVHVVIDPLIFSVYDVKAGPWTLDFKWSLNYYVDINFVLFNHQTTSTRTLTSTWTKMDTYPFLPTSPYPRSY